MILTNCGYGVCCARDVDETRSCLSRGACDLAIIGHSIPNKDKLVLIQEFRKRSKAPVLALARSGEARLTEVDYYVNPGDPEDLIAAVDRILKRKTRPAK